MPASSRRARSSATWGLLVLAGGALASVASCSLSTSTQVSTVPLEGIIVRAQSIVGPLGCGPSDDEVFKYAVALRYAEPGPDAGDAAGGDSGASNSGASVATGTPVAFGVYDCFTDAYFAKPPPSPTGSPDFDLEIYAMNSVAYAAQASFLPPGVSDPALFTRIAPTWTTRCTATQKASVRVVALCEPLAPSTALGGIVLPTSAFTLPSGAAFQCPASFASSRVTVTGTDAARATVEAPADGGTTDGDASAPDGDASVPDGGDAGAPDADAGDADAGATGFAGSAGFADFAGFAGPTELAPRSLPSRADGTAAPSVTLAVPCSGRVVLDALAPGDAYRFDVELLGTTGALVARTRCEVTATPGVTVTPRCEPVAPFGGGSP